MKPAPPRKVKGEKRDDGTAKWTGRRRLDGEVLDVPATAALLGATEKVVRARAARGLLPYRKWSGRVVFLRAELLTFLTKLDGITVDQALENVAQRNGGGT